MKKTDEIVLEGKIREDPDRNIYEILEVIGMHPKRAAYILLKWSKKGRWNYGINVMHGWFEEQEEEKFAKGAEAYFDPEYAKKVIEAMDNAEYPWPPWQKKKKEEEKE